KDAKETVLVGLDLLRCQQLPHVILAGRIADLGRSAAHYDDRLVSCLLETAQRHDLHQAAHVGTRSSAVETDKGGNALFLHEGIQAFRIGALMKVTACSYQLEKFGTEFGHATITLAHHTKGQVGA